MREVIGEVLPFTVVVMVSPVNIIAAILLLFSPRPLPAAGAYLAGFAGGVAVAVVGLDVIANQLDWSAGSETSALGALLRIVLGIVLVVVAVKKLGASAGTDAPELPGWMSGVTVMAPGRAASMGLAVGALNPKNLAMAAVTSMAVGGAGLSGGESAIVVAVYVVLASAGVAAPVVVAAVGGDRSTVLLAEARTWLERNHTTVMGVMYLVFAPVLVGKGIAAL